MNKNCKRSKVLSVSLDEQREEFLKYEEELGDINNLPQSSSKIFKDISRALSFRISFKALYLSLKRNYNKIFDLNGENDNPSDSSCTSQISSERGSSNNESTIIINLDDESWAQVKPVIYYSARNDKHKVKSELNEKEKDKTKELNRKKKYNINLKRTLKNKEKDESYVEEELKNDFPKESILSEDPLLYENWRGLVVKTPQSKPTAIKNTNKPIHLLKNGNICSSGVKGIVLENTCAFDSLVQICAVGYVDRNCLMKAFDEKNSDFSKLVKALATNDYATNINATRTKVIEQYYYDKIEHNHVTVINCLSNISFSLDKILINDIPSVISCKKCSNKNCIQNLSQVHRYVSHMPLNILVLAESGISSIGEAAQAMLNLDLHENCTKLNDGLLCTGKLAISYQLTDFLIFELDDTDKINLDNIPRNLELQGMKFNILGVIEFKSHMRHYVAHCKRLDGRWERYDDLESKVSSTKNKEMFVHSIFYTVL